MYRSSVVLLDTHAIGMPYLAYLSQMLETGGVGMFPEGLLGGLSQSVQMAYTFSFTVFGEFFV